MKAYLRQIRISPKKANLIAGTVRGKKVSEALSLLKFMPKKGADILYKVVHSAASNAKHNFKQSMDDLYILSILVTKGPTYKRSIPISRGRAHPIRKRTANITVEVGLPGGAKVGLPSVKKDKVEASSKQESKSIASDNKSASKEVKKKADAKPKASKSTEKTPAKKNSKKAIK